MGDMCYRVLLAAGPGRGAAPGPVWKSLSLTEVNGKPTRRREISSFFAWQFGFAREGTEGSERERERERESFLRNNLHNGVVSGAAR